MKPKREDLGLYFALGLVGAGFGLLIGSLIASKLARNEEPVLEEPSQPEPVYIPTRVGKKKPKKTKEASLEDDEFKQFVIEYAPTQIQLQLYGSGLVTIEELKDLINRERFSQTREPYAYYEPYFESGQEQAFVSDVVPVLEDEQVVDDRYQLSITPPAGVPEKKIKHIFWDSDNELVDSFSVVTKSGSLIPQSGLPGWLSVTAWSDVKAWLQSGIETLYVHDLETGQFFKFQIEATEDEEEFSEDYDGPDT